MLAALLSGILSAVALPTVIGPYRLPDLGFLAWVGLVPLYLYLKKGNAKAFRAGFLFSAAYHGLSLYWIFIAMHRYGEIPVWGSLLGTLLVVLFLSLLVGAGIALAQALSRRGVPLAIAFPLASVFQSFVVNFFPFGGFPWTNIAYTQRSFLLLLQILDLTGIYGITFLILLANSFVAEVILWMRKKRRAPVSLAGWFLILCVSVLFYGKVRLEEVRKNFQQREKLRIALIQGNVPQDEKWIEEKVNEIIARHLVLSRRAQKADLLIWPEAAYPAVIPPQLTRVDFFKSLSLPLLMGVVTYEGRIPAEWPPLPDDHEFVLHNSAILVQPGGEIVDRYDKTHLVPMGEYVPMGRFLFFLTQIVPSISSFTPGKEPRLMKLPVQDNQFGVTICYEDLFPEISRKLTKQGADFLVNLTNDAWYEKSSAVFQHFDFSRYRAIENRRAMVRATNTGETGFFSPTGEVIASAPVFEEAVLTSEIPLGGVESFYTRFGDVFAWGCIVALGLVAVRRKR